MKSFNDSEEAVAEHEESAEGRGAFRPPQTTNGSCISNHYSQLWKDLTLEGSKKEGSKTKKYFTRSRDY